MASRQLIMPQSTSPRWIVIPPCADHTIFYAAVEARAEELGLRLVHAHQDHSQADIVLTDDVNHALVSGTHPQNIAALFSQAGPLPDSLADYEPNNERHNLVSHSSELARRALSLPIERRFNAQQLAAGPVGLFPGFELRIPGADQVEVTARNEALRNAMAIYTEGKALWSPDLLDIWAPNLDRIDRLRSYDVTGKPRFMAHGPYIVMPKGQWQAKFKLGFSEPLCGKSYRMDWGGISDYSKLEFTPEKPGLYEIVMDWEWSEPAPCEIRLLVMEGVFDGELIIEDMEISHIG